MKDIIFKTGLFFVLLLAIGCGPSANYRHLVATGWELEEIIYDDSVYSISPPVEITIQFAEDSKVSGNGGCNSFFGVFAAEGEQSINIELQGSTLIYCDHMQFEERYTAILNLADRYNADKDRLELRSTQERVTLLYKPIFTKQH